MPSASHPPPLPASLADPLARTAAIQQLIHLPWGHPHAVRLRQLFREAGA